MITCLMNWRYVKMRSKNHLNKEIRNIIEESLDKNYNFTKIAKIIYKDRRTISREILNHRIKKYPGGFNDQVNYYCENNCNIFCKDKKKSCYKEKICSNLLKPPYVCNGCKNKAMCKHKIKYYYYAKNANDEYKEKLISSRTGINLTKEEVYEINRIIKPLIVNNGHSINQVYTNHKDILYFAKSTFYKYIDMNIFGFKNIDLPKKVKYKKRKENDEHRYKKALAILESRKYEDFEIYMSKHPNASIIEMDTVIGVQGGKAFLTLHILKTNFMLIFIIENKTENCIGKQFEMIKNIFGKELYQYLFEVVLTDNGVEFYNPLSIELDSESGEVLSQVFYCHPSASYEKGSIEKNHEFIREILPQGTTFNNLEQKDCELLMSHINSIPRDLLGGATPYELTENKIIPKEVLTKLGIKKISPDDVCRKSRLLKK